MNVNIHYSHIVLYFFYRFLYFLQAKRYGHSLEREIGYLTAHSMLHLLGYDHENGGMERVRMREKEEYVMSQLGLPGTSSYTV